MLTNPPRGGRTAILLILFCFTWGASGGLPAAECASVVARAVSVQGRVEASSGDAPAWTVVHQGDTFCPGDRLRVGANSRAGIVLNDETLLRLAENSSVRISAPREDGSAWLDLLQGIAHFISRVRQTFQVDTPFVNASIEGTEFTVRIAQDRATVSVLEGRVRASNPQGEVRVEGGQRALALAGQPPRIEAVVAPLDAVQWALYYPPVIEPTTAQAPAAVQQAVEADRRGDLDAAFSALAKVPGIDQDAGLLVYRASLQLQVGGTDAARRDLDTALRLAPAQPDALALRSIIATVQNERDQALDLAQQAVAADPRAAAPLLALSYARQARFELREALDAAERATQVAPDNALAWARLARLQLMFRHMDEALDAAGQAVKIDPEQAQTQTTLGFARLIRLDLAGAQSAFDKAAALDQAAPLPRLGLGLVEIRRGNLAAGRRLIETAANLDPGNALIRSYLGKAYYEEKRDKRAATQFALARQFDDLDPTAWFYDAILKQSENRPLEALSDLQSAIARNDNRAVYRSRLLLDDDQAARSASLARIYEDLGFGRLALKESWKSLAADPANFSAHRFLSDAYTTVPRHEIARVSERLQSELLNPEIVAPVSPSASEAKLLAVKGSGPSLSGFNEYNPLFNSQRLALLASGVTGSNNTRGEEIAVGGFTNRGMLSAGYYRESSDGFRDNNDSTQTIRNVFGQ
ncbi:MAG: FecR domain-containing protein, partial [Candidatus Thiodiazotropha sp.]